MREMRAGIKEKYIKSGDCSFSALDCPTGLKVLHAVLLVTTVSAEIWSVCWTRQQLIWTWADLHIVQLFYYPLTNLNPKNHEIGLEHLRPRYIL